MEQRSQLIVVDASVLPDVIGKVLEELDCNTGRNPAGSMCP